MSNNQQSNSVPWYPANRREHNQNLVHLAGANEKKTSGSNPGPSSSAATHQAHMHRVSSPSTSSTQLPHLPCTDFPFGSSRTTTVPPDDAAMEQLSSSSWALALRLPQTQKPSTSSQASTNDKVVRRGPRSCSGSSRQAHQDAKKVPAPEEEEPPTDEDLERSVLPVSLDNGVQQLPSNSNQGQAVGPVDLRMLRDMLEVLAPSQVQQDLPQLRKQLEDGPQSLPTTSNPAASTSTFNNLPQQIPLVDDEARNQPSTSRAGSAQPPRTMVNYRAHLTNHAALSAAIQRENWSEKTPVYKILHTLVPASSGERSSSSRNGSPAPIPRARNPVNKNLHGAVAEVLKALEEGRRRNRTPPTDVEMAAKSNPQPTQSSSSNVDPPQRRRLLEDRSQNPTISNPQAVTSTSSTLPQQIPVIVLDEDATDQPSTSNAAAYSQRSRAQPAQKAQAENEFDDRRKEILRDYRAAAPETWEFEYGFPNFSSEEIAVIYKMLDSVFFTYQTFVYKVLEMHGLAAEIEQNKMKDFAEEERRKEKEYLWWRGFYHTEFLRLDQEQRCQLLHKDNLTTQKGLKFLEERTRIPTQLIMVVVEKFLIFTQQYIPSARNSSGVMIQTDFGDLLTLHLSRKQEEDRNGTSATNRNATLEKFLQTVAVRLREREENIEDSIKSALEQARKAKEVEQEAEQRSVQSIDETFEDYERLLESGQDVVVKIKVAEPVDVQPYTTLPSLQRLRQPLAVSSQSQPTSSTQPSQPKQKAGRPPKKAAPTSSEVAGNSAGPSTSTPRHSIPPPDDMMSDAEQRKATAKRGVGRPKKNKGACVVKRKSVGRPRKNVNVSIGPSQQPWRAFLSTGTRSRPSTSFASADGSLNLDGIRVSARDQENQYRQISTLEPAPDTLKRKAADLPTASVAKRGPPPASPTVAVTRGVGRPRRNNGRVSNATVPVPPSPQRRSPSRDVISPPPFVPANAAGSSSPAVQTPPPQQRRSLSRDAVSPPPVTPDNAAGSSEPTQASPTQQFPWRTYQQRMIDEDRKVERYADSAGIDTWFAARAARATAANAEPVNEAPRDGEMPQDEDMPRDDEIPRDEVMSRDEEMLRDNEMGAAERESRKRRIEETENGDVAENVQPPPLKRPTNQIDDDASTSSQEPTDDEVVRGGTQSCSEANTPDHQDQEEEPAPEEEEGTMQGDAAEEGEAPTHPSTSAQAATDNEVVSGGPRSCSPVKTPSHQDATKKVPVVKEEIHDDEYGTAQVVSGPSTSGPRSSTEVRSGTESCWTSRQENVNFPIIVVQGRAAPASQPTMSLAQSATVRAVKVEEPDDFENQIEESVVPPNEDLERSPSPRSDEAGSSSTDPTVAEPNEELERTVSPESNRGAITEPNAIHVVDAAEGAAPEETPAPEEKEMENPEEGEAPEEQENLEEEDALEDEEDSEEDEIPEEDEAPQFTAVQSRTLQAIFEQTSNPSEAMQQNIALHLRLDILTVANYFEDTRRRLGIEIEEPNDVDDEQQMVSGRATAATQAMVTLAQSVTERAVKIEEPDELENQNEEPCTSSADATVAPPNEELERGVSPENGGESNTEPDAIQAPLEFALHPARVLSENCTQCIERASAGLLALSYVSGPSSSFAPEEEPAPKEKEALKEEEVPKEEETPEDEAGPKDESGPETPTSSTTEKGSSSRVESSSEAKSSSEVDSSYDADNSSEGGSSSANSNRSSR